MVEDIHKTIEAGDAAAVEAILNESPAALTAISRLGDTPLHKAVWQQNAEIARLLLERGADVDAIGNQGNLPIHYAADLGHADLARLLIQSGSSIHTTNTQGFSPLLLAARGREPGCPDVAGVLLESGAKLDLHAAVCLGRADEVRRILDTNKNAIAKCAFKEDLVVDAVIAHSAEIVELLVAHGVGVDDFKLSGSPAIFSTLGSRSDPAMVKTLIENGANVNSKNQSGKSVLAVAKRGGNQAIIDQIVEAGGKE